MKNTQRIGTCAYCEEPSDRLFDPPVLLPNWETVTRGRRGGWFWKCINGHVSPSERAFLVNKPDEFDFNGWLDPIWKGRND